MRSNVEHIHSRIRIAFDIPDHSDEHLDRLARLVRAEKDVLPDKTRAMRDRWTAPLILNAFTPSS